MEFIQQLETSSKAVQRIVTNFNTYYTRLEQLNTQVESYNTSSEEVSFATLNSQILISHAQLTKLGKEIETRLQDEESDLTDFERNTLSALRGEITEIFAKTTINLDEENLNTIKSDIAKQQLLIVQLEQGINKSSFILSYSTIKRSFLALSSRIGLSCTISEPSLDRCYNAENINNMDPFSVVQMWMENNVFLEWIKKESSKFTEDQHLFFTKIISNGKLQLSLEDTAPPQKLSLREKIASVFQKK